MARSDICRPEWRRRLKRACGALNALLAEVKAEHPHAALYLTCGTLNLMWGAPHGEADGGGGPGAVQHQERVLCSTHLYADGGDW